VKGIRPNKILVIDDDDAIRESLKDIFEAKGYDVEGASIGGEALRMMYREPFDAALIDIKLSDIDGLVLLKELKKISPEIICIIMTGNATMQNAVKALKEGADDYFIKPLMIDDVLHRIHESLEKRRLRQDLKASEERYRFILDNASDAIMLVNEQWKMEYVNPNFLKILGYSRDVFLGRSLQAFIHPDEIKGINNSGIESLFMDEHPREMRFLHQSGRYIWFEVKGKTLISREGEKKSLLFSRDITERKESEKKLKESEKRYRNLITNLSDTVIKLDAKCNILYTNPQVFDVTGYYPNEIAGSSLFSIIHTNDTSRVAH
jgi:PAS domain S-box-containing protein